MDLSELRDLLDYLENRGVDDETIRRVFERYAPGRSIAVDPEPPTPGDQSEAAA
jgi:hypothetical protein